MLPSRENLKIRKPRLVHAETWRRGEATTVQVKSSSEDGCELYHWCQFSVIMTPVKYFQAAVLFFSCVGSSCTKQAVRVTEMVMVAVHAAREGETTHC